MLCEVAIIVVWDIVVLHDGGPEGRTFDPFSDFFTAGSFPLAMVFGLLVLTGFESLQVFRSETRNPEEDGAAGNLPVHRLPGSAAHRERDLATSSPTAPERP